ncbi:MAG: hypothetical protein ACLUIQ_03555 [Dialister invisus]
MFTRSSRYRWRQRCNKEKKATVCEELNALNDQYRMKYSVDEAGNVLLTCCIAGLDHLMRRSLWRS